MALTIRNLSEAKAATETKRPINESERQILDRLLHVDFPGAAELRVQAARSQIDRLDIAGGPVFEFNFSNDVVRASVSYPVPVEAEGVDQDGARMHLLLHVRDGVLQELEIYREDGQQIQRLPKADSVDVMVNPG